MEFNLADLFEAAVDAYPEREYLVAGDRRRTYAEMEARANRLAHHLAAQGIGHGDHVGIYAANCVEWVETAWAVFKLRAVWININYRYVEDELRYLFTNADLKALVHQREFSPRVTALLPALHTVEHVIVIDDGSGEPDSPGAVHYEEALAAAGPERDFGPRSPDDRYILYTGGTTGMPKGVVWRHEDVFYALGGGVDALTNVRVQRPEEMVEKGRGGAMTHLPIAPLMHGATQWAVMGQSFVGSKIVLMARFDPHEVWRLIERERVNSLMVTGDAMAKPLVEALDDPGATHDVSSLVAVVSSAALFSAPVKDQFFAHLPNILITDAIGSSESGNNGLTVISKDSTAMRSGPTVHVLGETVVLDERLQKVEPGSGVIGKIARTGNIPLGYYNDPTKTAEVFITVAGSRYVMPGDFATVEADGSVTLLGRGSVVINSGGEKIFPEEVESAVRSHPEVMDAIVVGAADERWGQTVAAIVQPRAGMAPTLEAIQEHCRASIAGYKLPRRLHTVEMIERSPSGKPDYRWAAAIVATAPPDVPVDLRRLLTGGALPGGRPQEEPGALPVAVLTMELQRGVMGDLASFPELATAAEAAGVVANTARLLAGARARGLPVVHCTAGFRADRAGTVVNTPLHSAVLRRPGHLLEGTPGTELVPDLGPEPGDLVSARAHGVSPFAGTSLDATLRNLGARVLVVTGVSVNLGILGLCIEAVNLGYQVAVPVDAVAGVPADYAAEVVRLSLSLIATLTTVDELVSALA